MRIWTIALDVYHVNHDCDGNYDDKVLPAPMSLEDMPKRSYRELHNLVVDVVAAAAAVAAEERVGGLNKQQEDKACCSWAQNCICYTPILPM